MAIQMLGFVKEGYFTRHSDLIVLLNILLP